MKFLIYLLSLLFFLFYLDLHSQSLNVLEVDGTAFPLMKAKLFYKDINGKLGEITKENLEISENGKTRSIISINCPSYQNPIAISSVLTIDISFSMSRGAPNIDLAKSAALSWVKAMDLNISECALTSFDNYSYLNQDFTQDSALLNKKILDLNPVGGTNYNEAFLNPFTGNLVVAKNGRFKKVIIFLTDGLPEYPVDEDNIIRQANEAGITIYCVTVSMLMPQSLKNISNQTGGKWFQNVLGIKEAVDLYLSILNLVQTGNPCTVEWLSDNECNPLRIVRFLLKNEGIDNFKEYSAPLNSIPDIIYSLSSLNFGVVIPLSSKDLKIRLEAKNTPIIISNIQISNNLFSIVNGTPPDIVIQPGKPYDLTVRYSPVDTTYQFAKIEFITNGCNNYFYASGGGFEKSDKKSGLKIIKPNGGELYIASSDSTIEWQGVPPEVPVSLDYSLDNGFSWNRITDSATQNIYYWSIPDTMSNNCLIKAGLSSKNKDLTLTGHTGAISSVCWDNKGLEVFSGSKDSSVKSWDVIKGKPGFTSRGHYDYISSVGLSMNGDKLATGSFDGTIKIRDALTGNEIRNLYGHSSVVTALAWNPKRNNSIASVSYDGDVRIWNTDLGTSGQPLDNHTGKLFSVDWSPDGTRVVSGGEDKIVNIWDAGANKLMNSLTGTSDKINCVRWSPAGDKIGIASNDGYIFIYSILNFNLIKSYKAHEKSVTSFAWSPDGNFFATGSEDSIIKIWDIDNYSQIFSLAGHRGGITSLSWSPGGDYIASGSNDSTIKLWNISLQSDVSDSVWAIVKPIIKSFDVDMKEQIVGFAKDSTIVGFIRNSGNQTIIVQSIEFTGVNSSEFGIVSPLPPFQVNAGEDKDVELRFLPKSRGLKNCNIAINIGAKIVNQSIKGLGIEPEVVLDTKIIDFGKVFIFNFQELENSIIKNTGNTRILINKTEITGPDKEQFTIIEGGGSFYLEPNGGNRLVKIKFSPLKTGRTSSTISFYFNGYGSPVTALLYGEGIGETGEATLQPGIVEAEEGDTVLIPIYLRNPKNVIQSGATAFSTVLIFDSDILLPVENTPMGYVDNGKRRIRLELPAKPDKNDVLASFKFVAAFGSNERTDLILDSSYSIGGDVIIKELQGEFTLKNLCVKGGSTRLFKGTKLFYLNEIIPNPVQIKDMVEINYGIIEEGEVQLMLMDLTGKLTELDIQYKYPGEYSYKFDPSTIPSGIYFIILKSGSLIQMKPLLMHK